MEAAIGNGKYGAERMLLGSHDVTTPYQTTSLLLTWGSHLIGLQYNPLKSRECILKTWELWSYLLFVLSSSFTKSFLVIPFPAGEPIICARHLIRPGFSMEGLRFSEVPGVVRNILFNKQMLGCTIVLIIFLNIRSSSTMNLS